jgi:superfamily II DNA or RNA helicase
MGSGKTLISAALCSYHLSQKPTNKVLFVVYDRNILSQTMTNFKKYGLNVSQFGDSIKDLTGDIVVATIQSLQRIEKPREVLKNISWVFCDEAHHGKSKSSRDVLTRLPNCEYFIGLTATPYRERTLETAQLTAILGPVIFEYGFSDSVAAGNIVPVKAFFLDVEPDLNVKEEIFTRKNYKIIWDMAIQYNQTRNNQIATICQTLIELLDTPILINVDRIKLKML